MIYLSIIIPVYNEERFIKQTLEMLARQAYPPERFEIIVVDGMSTDETWSRVEQFGRENQEMALRLFKNPGRLSSRGRNIGIHESRGVLVGVIDGHVYLPNDQLFNTMERIKEKTKTLCLARPAPLDVPGLSEGVAYWISLARKTWLGHSRNSYIYSDFEGYIDPMSSGFAYDRSVFEKVGTFDENFDAAEDVEFHFRLKQAGIRAYTSPDLLIYSYPRESFNSLFKQQVRYGIGRARLVHKHPGGFTKETPVPSLIVFFCGLWLISLPLFPFFPFLGMSLSAFMALYWAILLWTGFRAALGEKRFLPGFFVAGAILTTHLGLGWGFLKTFFMNRFRKKNGREISHKTTLDH